MAALREELRYGLSCAKINRSLPNKSLYHVKLTDTAMRALEAFQNFKGAGSSQPVICFKGTQGYIKIPSLSPSSPGALRLFSFYLSSDSKEKPQSSFDCIHHYVSSSGRDQLECQGSIQDKITVCATDDSYQMTRERVSQVEKETWSRSAIEIKPSSTYRSKCIKLQKKQSLPPTPDNIPFRKHSPTSPVLAGKRGTLSSSILTSRSLRDRIIHLLALKPYKKPELIVWLERDKAHAKDKMDLASVLEEVAKLNPKDSSYSLKDELFRHVQKDWPGYSEEDKQLLHRLLLRQLPTLNMNQPKNNPSNMSFQKLSGDSPSHASPVSSISVKRILSSETSHNQVNKKQKVLESPQLPPDCLSSPPPTHCTTASSVSSFLRRADSASESQNSFLPSHQYSNSGVNQSPRKTEGDLKQAHYNSLRTSYSHKDESSAISQHKKKKSKKHRDKERQPLKEGESSEWEETSPDLKYRIEEHEKASPLSTPTSPSEMTDYLIKYITITSEKQRQDYKSDFCAEYDEYRDLHSRIGNVTEKFVQLGSQIKTLSPGTKEYKVIEDQIIEEYRKYKKKCPGYNEEKKRCEYLHQKLSHIKRLILDYDQTNNAPLEC
ncbi:RNA polymerase II elongation factor ELL2 [Erpetoichthys calabaricus]|uniref:RNA polymerase II elongation factor ELL2 n=1 Tax=Erpetoichthys calabaricus TaxID=27687 RepID=UPI0022343E34|nr:RNA polymerase II elongation factor ELL2 [Erpetoichthys calabaricus]